MKLLDSYIAKTVLSAIGLVTLMLVGLQIFILFVNELGDIGRADYGIWQASWFILLQLPYKVYLFFPMASLLGCLIGLGMMANHRELVVMRAAGMSIGQITKAVLKAAVLIIFLATILGETIVPWMSLKASDFKAMALSGGQALRTEQGVWFRHGNDFISVGSIYPDTVIHTIYQFHFDEMHRMTFVRLIEKAIYKNNAWVAYHVQQTDIGKDQTKAYYVDQMPWNIPVKPQILKISSVEPDEMTLHELNRFLREQSRSHQKAPLYQLAFWQRIIQPFTTMVMMILAIPFIFGPLRSSTMGSKLVVGACVGFGFHMLNHFFGPISIVFQFSAQWAAFGPTIVFAFLGMYLMRRVR